MKKDIDIIEKVLRTIDEYKMLAEGDRVVVGLSGGPDSVCLFHILWRLKERFHLQIFPVYVNHHLRGEDEIMNEIEFIRRFVKDYGMDLIMKDVDVRGFVKSKGMSIEEGARELRYMALHEVLNDLKAQRIAVGHNASDQAETIIMRLIRGTGPWGLRGILPVRGLIIRPLIEVKKREIEDYLYREGLHYTIDFTNLKEEYIRNRIRLVIIPRMEEINPSLIDTLLRMAKIFYEEELFEREISGILSRAIESKIDGELILSLTILQNIEKSLLRRILRNAIDEIMGLEGITFEHIESIINLIKKGRSGDRVSLPRNLRIIKSYSCLILTVRNPVILGEYTLKVPGELYIEEINKVIKTEITQKMPLNIGDGKTRAVFDYDRVGRNVLNIRGWRHGDFFYPIGFGKRKKLQDFFVDNKIPKDERYSIPLILSNNDIIWIAGYRPDDRFRITQLTERYLIIEMVDHE